MLGFPLLYFKGMRLMMFQLSSFYCIEVGECIVTRYFDAWGLRVIGKEPPKETLNPEGALLNPNQTLSLNPKPYLTLNPSTVNPLNPKPSTPISPPLPPRWVWRGARLHKAAKAPLPVLGFRGLGSGFFFNAMPFSLRPRVRPGTRGVLGFRIWGFRVLGGLGFRLAHSHAGRHGFMRSRFV